MVQDRQLNLRQAAISMAEKYGIDPNIFVRMINQESKFDPNAHNKSSGAAGLGQITKPTGIQPGYGVNPIEDRYDPIENLRFSAEYFRAMLKEFDGSYPLALAAYNAGPGRVKGAGREVPDIPETQNYVKKIMAGESSPSAPGPKAPPDRPSVLSDPAQSLPGSRNFGKAVDDFLSVTKRPRKRPPGVIYSQPRSGGVSPLSQLGIPGLNNYKRYSAPGGVASLMKKKA